MSKQDMSKKLTSINSLCSLIEFSGEGVIDFLNNLLISDLNTFRPNQLYYSVLCNPKGRIISSMFLTIKSPQHVILFCPQNISGYLTQFFTMRKFRLKFSITPNDQLSKPMTILSGNIFYEILSSKSKSDFFLTLFAHNLPWIDANNTEKFIPQHVNLDQHDNIMSFTKGCYPGQEIIARLKYLGKVKKRMQLLTSDSITKIESDHKLISPIIQLPNGHFQAQVL